MTNPIYADYQTGNRLSRSDGNLLTDARRTYTRDAENRLKTITWTAAQDPQGFAGSIEYFYDGLSRRVGRSYTRGGSLMESVGYQYDGWNHIMTVNQNGSRVAAYVWGPDVGSSFTAGRSMQSAGGWGDC